MLFLQISLALTFLGLLAMMVLARYARRYAPRPTGTLITLKESETIEHER